MVDPVEDTMLSRLKAQTCVKAGHGASSYDAGLCTIRKSAVAQQEQSETHAAKAACVAQNCKYPAGAQAECHVHEDCDAAVVKMDDKCASLLLTDTMCNMWCERHATDWQMHNDVPPVVDTWFDDFKKSTCLAAGHGASSYDAGLCTIRKSAVAQQEQSETHAAKAACVAQNCKYPAGAQAECHVHEDDDAVVVKMDDKCTSLLHSSMKCNQWCERNV